MLASLFDRNYTQNELGKFARAWAENLQETESSGG